MSVNPKGRTIKTSNQALQSEMAVSGVTGINLSGVPIFSKWVLNFVLPELAQFFPHITPYNDPFL